MKQSSLFSYLFYRVALILLLINILSSLLLLPVYKEKLVSMIAIQSNTFAQSTLATVSDALYTEDYSFIISYLQKVLKKTPEIEFVSFTHLTGKSLHLTAKSWKFITKSSPPEPINFSTTSRNLKHLTFENDENSIFLFTRKIHFSGLDWGVFKLGLKDTEYQSLLNSYFRNVLLISLVLILLSLLLIKGSSLKLERQLTRLRDTASKLAGGNLSARSSTQGIGEISVLARTFNSMADNLQENTRNIQRLARIVEDTPDAIALFDKNQKITFVNHALKVITSQDESFFQGMSFKKFIRQLNIEYSEQFDVSSGLLLAKQQNWSTDVEIKYLDQVNRHMTLRVELLNANDQLDEDQGEGFFIVLSDITHRKSLENELEELAYIDLLTRLPNRRLFTDRLYEAVQQAETLNTNLAVMFLDLDNFKVINDTLGHEVGDVVLSEVSSRLQSILRTDDIICRLGGDEFTAILKGIKKQEELIQIAQQIIQLFEQPIHYNKHELRISCSIGIVNYPDDGNTMQELTKNADTAMYAAKNSGKNTYRFFSQEMHSEMRDFLEVENSLRKAIKRSEFELVYQPIVDNGSQKIISCEALLRWNHPERGYISPDIFIPIAEQSSMIKNIGEWVFNEVCRQMQEWDMDIKVSVNISGNELIDFNFINRIRSSLKKHNVAAHKIQLEFTEHVLISKNRKNLALLNELNHMGFHLALDDFGTGFSSLSYLSELPIDVIKIDQSFIYKLPDCRKTIAVVNSIISLAQNLQISIIGEGCENRNQVNWLEQHGCHLIQGNYFHKPMTPDEFETLILNQKVFQFSKNKKARKTQNNPA